MEALREGWEVGGNAGGVGEAEIESCHSSSFHLVAFVPQDQGGKVCGVERGENKAAALSSKVTEISERGTQTEGSTKRELGDPHR